MSKFFNLGSPLMRIMTKVADLILLNILFLVTALPIVTVGAAWTAIHYVTLKMVRDEESGILKSYFHAFYLNFRQASLVWIGILSVTVVLILDLRISAGIDNPVAAAFNMGALILLVLLLLFALYMFPVLAKFDVSLFRSLKNAAMMAIVHFPQTLFMGAFVTGCGFLTFYNEYTICFGIPVWLLLGFALVAFGNASILSRIFDRYLSNPSESGDWS